MQCEDVANLLPGVGDGSVTLRGSARWHVDRCLRCQTELVQYRKVLRSLRTLRTEFLEPAPGLLADILATIAESGERHAVRQLLSGRRAAYFGGIAAATAAGAAGVVVLASMSRRSRFRVAS